MQELDLLNSKLEMLIKKYTALQAENRSMKDTILHQSDAIQQLNAQIASLQQQVTDKQITESFAEDKNKDIVRKQLDVVIGEIDKILNSLND